MLINFLFLRAVVFHHASPHQQEIKRRCYENCAAYIMSRCLLHSVCNPGSDFSSFLSITVLVDKRNRRKIAGWAIMITCIGVIVLTCATSSFSFNRYAISVTTITSFAS